MKIAGFLLLVTGWALVPATLALLGSGGARTAFILAALAIEVAGLGLVARAHLPAKEGTD